MDKKNFLTEEIEARLLEKLLRYIAIDTQSKEDVETYPSTIKQLDLARLLVRELKDIGISDVDLDSHGYVIASLSANLSATDKTFGKVPALGFIAHLDTSPETSGANVKPRVIRNYPGGDITLPADPNLVISVAEYPWLKNNIGKTIITSDGTTLLGADDKAGIAIIMTMLEFLLQHPEIKHGDIKIAFTPDEEVGGGTRFFDLQKFEAKFAYTLDGETAAELNKETFSANAAIITVHGKNVHPGKAKNIMINSIRIIADIIALMPKDCAPETTAGYQPYLHPYVLEGGVEKSLLKILLRDFETEGLDRLKNKLEQIIARVQALYPNAQIKLEIIESYRNMREELAKDSRVTDYLQEAVECAGLTPKWEPIRGGTDGSQLTAKGLPTPNIFTGGAGFHSKTEWVSVWEMGKSLETVLNLIQLWVEKTKT